MSDQFIVKEVSNLVFMDYQTQEPLGFTDYASVTTSDVKTTRIEVRGGQGNYLLGVVDHSKTVTVTLTLPLVDLKFVAMLNGDTITPQTQNVYQRDKLTVQVVSTGTINVTAGATTSGNVVVALNGTSYNVAVLGTDSANAVAGKIQAVLAAIPNVNTTVSTSTVTVTVVGNSAITLNTTVGTTGVTATTNVTSGNGVLLSKTPNVGTLSLYELVDSRDFGDQIKSGDPTTDENTYSQSGQVVSLNSTSQEIGDEVLAIYQYATTSTAKKVTIKANKFTKTLTIFGDSVFNDQVSEEMVPIKVQMYKAKPQGNITFTQDGTKATELTLTIDLMAVDLPNGDKGFMEYVVLPDEAVED